MLPKIKSSYSLSDRLRRLAWTAAWLCLHRPFPRQGFALRRMLLRLFGARIAPSARVYGSARVWAPWNLVMESGSVLADHVECYNVDKVTLRAGAIVSQHAFICTASHDVHDPAFPLRTAPVTLEEKAWVAAKGIVGMGVTVGAGAVVALGAVAVKNVPPGKIVGGNPACVIGQRDPQKPL